MAKKEKLDKAASVLAIATLLILALSACATSEGHRAGKRTGRSGRVGSGIPVEKEVKRPEQREFASVSNPARKASMEMVAKGKRYLEKKKYNRALGAFREAVIIDSTNGVAYYYMSKARYYMKQFEEALGILDKAETLLSTSEQWVEAIAILRSKIQSAYLYGNEEDEFDDEAERDDLIPIINKRESDT